MTCSAPLLRAALLGGVLALHSAPAAARERDCPGAAIDSDAAFGARYPELLAQLRGELSRRPDVDRCARVELRVEREPVIAVSVTLLDGRTALRSVQRAEELPGLLQALLLIPAPNEAPRAAPPERTTPSAAPARPSAASRDPSLESRRERLTPPSGVAGRELGVELSALGGARIGGGQVGYGVGAQSLLEVKSWLLGVMGRVDGYRSLQGGDPETALELALLGGRRLDWGPVALDLTAGPGVATLGFRMSETRAVQVEGMNSTARPSPPPAPEERPGAVPRLLLGARLSFSPRSVLRSFVGLDLDMGRGLTSGSGESVAESARLPSFSVGLSVGATVGTR